MEWHNRHVKLDVKLVTAANWFFQDHVPKEFQKWWLQNERRESEHVLSDGGCFEKDIVNRNDDDDDESTFLYL